MDFVAGTSLAVNNNKLRWSAAEETLAARRHHRMGRVKWKRGKLKKERETKIRIISFA